MEALARQQAEQFIFLLKAQGMLQTGENGELRGALELEKGVVRVNGALEPMLTQLLQGLLQ
jgi:hypothetical protein